MPSQQWASTTILLISKHQVAYWSVVSLLSNDGMNIEWLPWKATVMHSLQQLMPHMHFSTPLKWNCADSKMSRVLNYFICQLRQSGFSNSYHCMWNGNCANVRRSIYCRTPVLSRMEATCCDSWPIQWPDQTDMTQCPRAELPLVNCNRTSCKTGCNCDHNFWLAQTVSHYSWPQHFQYSAAVLCRDEEISLETAAVTRIWGCSSGEMIVPCNVQTTVLIFTIYSALGRCIMSVSSAHWMDQGLQNVASVRLRSGVQLFMVPQNRCHAATNCPCFVIAFWVGKQIVSLLAAPNENNCQ